MRNQKVFDMVATSMIMAIILILAFVPNLGLITIPGLGLSFTIMHIPVLVAAIYLNRRIGMFAGLVFGLSTFVLAYIRALETPVSLDYLFRDPSLSVVPRVLFPLITALFYEFIRTKINNDSLNIFLASIVGSLIHSILVLTALFFTLANVVYMERATLITITDNPFTKNVFGLVIGVFITSSLIEALMSGIITTPIVKALKIAKDRTIEDHSSLLDEINSRGE